MNVVVAGLGLIGGSLYKASQRAGYPTKGLHHGESEGLNTADLVFVAMPADAIVPWITSHAGDFKQGAVVVDICGVKTPIVHALEKVERKGWTFVGGHPMAGKEVAGYANSTPDLFKGASMILTPYPGTDPAILANLKAYFKALGFGLVVKTTPEKHDEMIAFTSQLGHVIAMAYSQDPRVAEAIGFSAGSYANMTRIATMDPAGWASLFLENKASLLPVIDGFLTRMSTFREKLAHEDRPAIEASIQLGAEAKKHELAARKELNHV